ncbi:MAG: DNA topoisomerase IV [Bacteroidia bacterium]|nr:MAG: DNA topoisomerase IV [Bacteroidia bacterium]
MEEQKPSAERVPFINQLEEADTERVILTGMYKDWFLDYASYVILERAVPHLNDGLKPVQRRILHTMHRLEDGRYNKVANIVGHTMQFHPHGDASIGDALVGLGQKDLLIDTQGNWGNIITGDAAAAPRYIEARLTPFALDVLFNRKTTQWMKSYDGRQDEPITLPAKFPLLLVQGTEGIAVGLSCNVLPHNFNEVIDAAILYLQGKPFELYPDFPTGGLADCTAYADGKRGGHVKVRARIRKQDSKTVVIEEIPFSLNTEKLIESIRKENESGRIKVKRIEDNTAERAEIVVHLAPDMSPDKTIDALYAFTACEIKKHPNACVIHDDKPHFLGVSDLLRASVDHTRGLLTQELQIRMGELEDAWHYASLERLFIEHRLYLAIEECTTWEGILQTIEAQLQPYVHLLRRPLVEDDIVRLTEIKIKRISKYDKKKADELIRRTEKEMEEVQGHLDGIVAYTIAHFRRIKKKYGAKYPRLTEIAPFEEIQAVRVVANNKKLYVDRAAGFIGTELKGAEYLGECSDIDEVIVILRSGRYFVTQVAEKKFIEKDILYVGIYSRNDTRTVYNLVYLDGTSRISFWKRCSVTSVIRDREYDLTQGTPKSRLLYLSVNPNGEAERIRVLFDIPRMKNPTKEYDFSELAIRGRETKGNQLSKSPVKKVTLLERGGSTLEDIKIWIDRDVNRLNTEERGDFLGEFASDELVLAIYADGTYQTTSFDVSNRYGEKLLRIEKFDGARVFTVAYYDSDQGYYYLKRFAFEPSGEAVSFIGESAGARLMALSDDPAPQLAVVFGGVNINRPPERIAAADFIGVKSYRAKGKRISTYAVELLELIPSAAD